MVSMLPLPVGFIVAQQAVLYHMVSRVDIPTRAHTHTHIHILPALIGRDSQTRQSTLNSSGPDLQKT